MNIHFRACVQSVHHQHAHMISDDHATANRSIDNVRGQSQTKFASSVFAGVMNHFIHALLYNIPNKKI